jgi:hypothetical protein
MSDYCVVGGINVHPRTHARTHGSYLFLGERAARWCVGPAGVMGHTEGCARCFADNMGCTIAHCYHECMLKGLFLSNSSRRLGGGGDGDGTVNGTR